MQVHPVVEYVKDVGFFLGNDSQQFPKGARYIGNVCFYPHEPAHLNGSSLKDAVNGVDLDIPTADDEDIALHIPPHTTSHNRGQRGGARPFCNDVGFFQEPEDGAGDVLFSHGDHVIHMFLDDSEIQFTGPIDCNTVGNGGAHVHGNPLTRLERANCGGAALRLHTDDLGAGTKPLDRDGKPRYETSSSDRSHHCHLILQDLGQFQAYGPLSGDDAGIVVARNECLVRASGKLLGVGEGVVETAPVQDHLCAVLPDCVQLFDRHVLGHDNGCTDAQPLGGPRNALCVVACRGGDHSVSSLPVRELKQAIVCPPYLERTGFLKILQFEKGLHPQEPAEMVGADQRRGR